MAVPQQRSNIKPGHYRENHAALPLQRVTGLVLRLDAQVVLMPLKPLYMLLKQLRELPPMASDTSLVRQASLNEAAPLF
jgi:hypothetical protein